MKKILDKMFGNKKLGMLIPLMTAAFVYLLFVFFTKVEDKTQMIIATPVLSAIWFFGVFLIIFIQVKNKACPEQFLNLMEFVFTVAFGLFAVFGIISFVVSGFQSFNLGLCLGAVTYSAICWAHSKRVK